MDDVIATGYRDHRGTWREPPAGSVQALREILRSDPSAASTSTISLAVGTGMPLSREHELRLEDGSSQTIRDVVPPDVPMGYHQLIDLESERRTHLIVAPQNCWLPADLKTWGWAAQLYSVRSKGSWGMGDLGDLAELAEWSRELGAGTLMINPLHASGSQRAHQPSPYFPSSRCARDLLYLRIEDIEGASEAGVNLDDLVTVGRALNGERIIDRTRIHEIKVEALERIWIARGRAEIPPRASIEGFALFASLAEANAGSWRRWPEGLRYPNGSDIDGWKRDHAERIAFHTWVQALLDDQLERAGRETSLINDLAIGVDPDGADAWLWQDQFATGATVGAPPDEFNAAGQDWGVLAFDPFQLDRAGYEPFIQTIREALRHSGGIRFDHVMGLWRLFLIPEGTGPETGTYVRYPTTKMLDILALESRRAEAFVVGEDLGTVEPEVREEMGRRDMLSYRVFWFEEGPPRNYPKRSLATITNHDLPTIAGVWTGRDQNDQEEAGLEPDAGAAALLRRRLSVSTGLDADATVSTVVQQAYRLLAAAPSAILTATLEDALEVAERPNQPGTIDEFPNWSRALPRSLEQMRSDPLPRAIADALARDDVPPPKA
jgi:4-alpha-glucanotransferase